MWILYQWHHTEHIGHGEVKETLKKQFLSWKPEGTCIAVFKDPHADLLSSLMLSVAGSDQIDYESDKVISDKTNLYDEVASAVE